MAYLCGQAAVAEAQSIVEEQEAVEAIKQADKEEAEAVAAEVRGPHLAQYGDAYRKVPAMN